MVERVNGTLKDKLNTNSTRANRKWVDVLPLALVSHRLQTIMMLHVTLTGRPKPVSKWRYPYYRPNLKQRELELTQCMQQQTIMNETIHKKEKLRVLVPAKEAGTTKRGDQIMCMRFLDEVDQPGTTRPFRVTKPSPTVIQVEGISTCTRAVP
ncbi:hypothetical protein chiPu_0020987 [Chiloscyllium punctatum]|uniref:Uncharacterized protein n=1 Tax=Chiloscyllium punctatum TaxID=137246 RepID=A0A401RLY7_CHIPU|nr:hypothetical protein [Chiloscyllium punctatum]